MVTTGYTQAERARALAEYLGHAERIGRAAIHDGPPMTNESMQQRHNAAIQDMLDYIRQAQVAHNIMREKDTAPALAEALQKIIREVRQRHGFVAERIAKAALKAAGIDD